MMPNQGAQPGTRQSGPHVRIGKILLCTRGGGSHSVQFGWPRRKEAACVACQVIVAIADANGLDATRSPSSTAFFARLDLVLKDAIG